MSLYEINPSKPGKGEHFPIDLIMFVLLFEKWGLDNLGFQILGLSENYCIFSIFAGCLCKNVDFNIFQPIHCMNFLDLVALRYLLYYRQYGGDTTLYYQDTT